MKFVILNVQHFVDRFEQPTQEGIGSDNIGNKLMQKMGWNTGEGLGVGKHGIKDPVQVNTTSS